MSRSQLPATSQNFSFFTFSASLVLQHATTMRLIPPKSTITFARTHQAGDQKLDALLAEFAVELADDKPGKEFVMRALVEQALVHILRNYSQPRLSDELELSRVGLVDRRIRRSVELMHTQLDQDLTLEHSQRPRISRRFTSRDSSRN